MMTLKTVLMLGAVAATALPLHAATPSATGRYYLLKRKTGANPGRPQQPGIDDYVGIYIQGGTLTVYFPEDAEWGKVEIGTGVFVVFGAIVDVSRPTVELPPLTGEYNVTLTFDNGEDYAGTIAM